MHVEQTLELRDLHHPRSVVAESFNSLSSGNTAAAAAAAAAGERVTFFCYQC